MDLIYQNKAGEDVGILPRCKLDLAYGEDENDFELTLAAADHCCEAGFYIYAEDTEYGGVVDDIQSDTAAGEVTYKGRSWHGVLNSKIIEPDAGADYLVLTGEANDLLNFLIRRLGLASLFAASGADSGLQITGYKMNRYIAAYDGIRKMLSTVAGKLRFVFQNGRVILSAHPRGDYTQDNELDSDRMDFKAICHYRSVNHLICLGRGELAGREVIHLYSDAAGNVSKVQTIFGLEERAEIYENTGVESLDDLEEKGIERFKEIAQADEITASFDPEYDCYEVQDLVGATDNVTGLKVSAEITKKIVTIENDMVTISYKVGV